MKVCNQCNLLITPLYLILYLQEIYKQICSLFLFKQIKVCRKDYLSIKFHKNLKRIVYSLEKIYIQFTEPHLSGTKNVYIYIPVKRVSHNN